MDQGKAAGGLGGLVALEVADQVPLGPVADRLDLGQGLLDPAFPKDPLARRQRGFDHPDGVGLADGHQRDRLGLASGAARGEGDALADFRQAFGDPGRFRAC